MGSRSRRRVHKRRPLEEDEIARLLEASPAHYERIWVAFLTSGLRHKELVELRWRDIDLDGMRKLLRVAAETCKTRREDFLPIAPELEAVLCEIMPRNADREAHVFLNAAGNPWRNNLLRRFRSCLKAAGIDAEGLDIHLLRQTFGTRLASDPTIDVKTVQTLMRHKTIAMTMQLYVKPRAFRLREAVNNLALPESGKEKAKAAAPVAQAVGM
ncbi:MAG: tyrosine-type recombinase/integrase [Planctomycetota bacterium]|jgi:integrase